MLGKRRGDWQRERGVTEMSWRLLKAERTGEDRQQVAWWRGLGEVIAAW